MRLATLCLAVVGTLSFSGCSDLYYRAIGRGGWPHEEHTLYARLGAHPGLTAEVDQLVANVMLDPRINGYFAHADMRRMKALMVEQLCMLTQGPCVYTGRSMADAHAGLAVTGAAFDAFMENMRASLDQLAVPKDAQVELLTKLEALRGQIVVG